MTTEIYYFSGTGNSLHAARELALRLPGSRLFPVVGLLGKDRIEIEADTVGFVFPHYASTYPKVFGRFFDKMVLKRADYVFALATRGGTECAEREDLGAVLARQGKALDAFIAVNMPSGSSPILKDFRERITPEKSAALEAGLAADLDRLASHIEERRSLLEEDDRATTRMPPWMRPFRSVLLSFAKSVETKFRFYADGECTGCGVCERVCLAGRIRIEGGLPAWAEEKPCFACWACLNYCPAESAQIASKWYLKSYTPMNGRYHHPAVSAADIEAQKAAPDRS